MSTINEARLLAAVMVLSSFGAGLIIGAELDHRYRPAITTPVFCVPGPSSGGTNGGIGPWR